MEYLSKAETRNQRNDFNKMIEDIRLKINEEISFRLVGSARRNMVLFGNKGFDLDYQIILRKYPSDWSAKKLKDYFRKELFDSISDEYFLTKCEDSTHVLTMKMVNNDRKVEYSYDIALLKKNESNTEYLILKNDKKHNQLQEDYHFIQLPKHGDFDKKIKEVKGKEMWDKLRSIYKSKKEQQQNLSKDQRKISFSLLKESVEETLKTFNKK